MRLANVEFRRPGVEDSNGYITKDRRPEIIAWMPDASGITTNANKEYCYTICFFKEGKDDWSIETVGCRFTEYEDSKSLMHVAKYALRVLINEKNFKDLA